jgi:hypothetical protein
MFNRTMSGVLNTVLASMIPILRMKVPGPYAEITRATHDRMPKEQESPTTDATIGDGHSSEIQEETGQKHAEEVDGHAAPGR